MFTNNSLFRRQQETVPDADRLLGSHVVESVDLPPAVPVTEMFVSKGMNSGN